MGKLLLDSLIKWPHFDVADVPLPLLLLPWSLLWLLLLVQELQSLLEGTLELLLQAMIVVAESAAAGV